MEIFFIVSGFLIGLITALTGVGGGTLLLPLLLFLNFPLLLAIGTDMLFNFFTKLLNLALHHNFSKLKLRHEILISIILGIVLAFLASFFYFNFVSSNLLLYIVIFILLFGSIYNLLKFFYPLKHFHLLKLNNAFSFFIMSFIVASVAILVSIGSSLLISIMLLLFSKLKERDIVKLSLFFGTVSTFFGTLLYLTKGLVDFHTTAFLVIASIPGSLVGQYLHHKKLDERTLRFIITIFVFLATLVLIVKRFFIL